MKFKRLSVAILSMSLLLSACSGATTTSESSTAQESTAASTSQSAAESTADNPEPAETAASGEYFHKYDPPIVLTTHAEVPPTRLFQDGDTVEDNAWTRWQKETMGIEWKVAWASPDSTTNQQKLDLAFASGDMPDVIRPTASQLSKYVQAGMIQPIGGLIDQYASPLVKWGIEDAIEQTQGAFYLPVTIGGEIYAMPTMSDTIVNWNNGFIRQDILDELGMDMPTTIPELEAVFAAYKEKYPDKYPFAMENKLKAMQIVNAAYKAGRGREDSGYWVKMDDGSIGYGSIQPEAKQALEKMAEWYQLGYIDPEFVVKDEEKMKEDIIAGNFMTYYGVWASIASPFTPMWANVPEADPIVMPFLNGDDGQTKVYDRTWFQSMCAITTNCENPEALLYMMNDNWDSERRNNTELRDQMKADYGYEFKYPITEERQPINVEQVAADHPQATEPKELWKYDYPEEVQGMGYFNNFFTHNSRLFGFNGIPVSVLNADLKSMAEAYRTNDESILNSNSRTMWDQWNETTPNMVKNWEKTEAYWSVFEKSGNYVADIYAGAPTELMAEKQAYLNKLELETYTRIIMGTQSIDEFDTFVDNWNSNGGAEITAEINEWYKNNQ
ncbi:MAG: hypothetical protein ACK5LX_09210 [Oscillospiraceae bacterium]